MKDLFNKCIPGSLQAQNTADPQILSTTDGCHEPYCHLHTLGLFNLLQNYSYSCSFLSIFCSSFYGFPSVLCLLVGRQYGHLALTETCYNHPPTGSLHHIWSHSRKERQLNKNQA